MTPEEQDRFAAFMREHIPKPEGEKWHRLYFITEQARRVLKRSITHWRDLSADEARRVMKAVQRGA